MLFIKTYKKGFVNTYVKKNILFLSFLVTLYNFLLYKMKNYIDIW